jgi:hypothetical protein
MDRLDAHMHRGNRLMAEQTHTLRLLVKAIEEFGREMAGQRQALLRILDKLD